MSLVYGSRTRILGLLVSLIIAPQFLAQSRISKSPSLIGRQTPTIATNKNNYETDEVVEIAGVDFLSYERVRMSAKYVDQNLKQVVLLSSWDAFADSKGRISTEWSVLDVNGAGNRFIIEGKGAITGLGSRVEVLGGPPTTASITIVKQAAPPNEFQQFGFTASGGLLPASFNLLDDDADGIVNGIVGTDPSFNPSQAYPNITVEGTYTFRETTFGQFDLLSLTCVTNAGLPLSVVNLVDRSVSISVKFGDAITCTWVNSLITAAGVSVSGRVYDNVGRGLSRASVSVADSDGSLATVMTNHFGYYRIDDIEAGDGYVISVRHKGFSFPPRLVNVNDVMTGVDFWAK